MEAISVIVIATHAMFFDGRDVYGPPHAVSLFLNKKKIDHIFIKHRLEGGGYSLIEHHKKGKLEKTIEKGSSRKLPIVIQYFLEMIISLQIIFKEKDTFDAFIGLDPLNAVTGIILQKLGKVKKTVFFSADFALQRFTNPILNSMYLWLDKMAMFSSNRTWSVSQRIVSYRRKKGLKKERNLLFPNAPFFNSVKRKEYSQIRKNDLVIVSAINNGIAFELLVDVIGDLKKTIKNMRLIIIGSGPEEKNLRMYVSKKGLLKYIQFLGALSHEDMFTVLVNCGVGIALYTNSDPKNFRYFSDPMKVRDYLASGLPVIISGNAAINDELRKENAGIVVQLTKKTIASAVKEVLTHEDKYKAMRQNALELAKEHDTYTLLEKYLSL